MFDAQAPAANRTFISRPSDGFIPGLLEKCCPGGLGGIPRGPFGEVTDVKIKQI